MANALFHREKYHGIGGGHRVVEHAVVLLVGKAMAVILSGIFFLEIRQRHNGHGIDPQCLNPFYRRLQDRLLALGLAQVHRERSMLPHAVARKVKHGFAPRFVAGEAEVGIGYSYVKRWRHFNKQVNE